MDLTQMNLIDHSRERQLWCAVIGRAVQDAIRQAGETGWTAEHARHREEARRWFVDNSSDFRKACEAAGYDPDFVRERVLRLTGENAPAQPRALALVAV